MRPLDRFARILALTNPALLVYGPDMLRGGPAALAYDPAQVVVAALGTLVSVGFHVYDCRKRADQAACEREQATEAERARVRAAIARAAALETAEAPAAAQD